MKHKFIFDVDGTLTPSRGQIDPEFKSWFNDFCQANDVYLVTGSDRSKTIEQIGEDTYNLCKRVYNCSGSDVYEGSASVKTSEWKPPVELYHIMNGWLQSSRFDTRTGNHIEERPGTVNFSIVGRNATSEQRSRYVEWDVKTRERETVAYMINSAFDNITATIGGETGIDIYYTGHDKSQILCDFDKNIPIYFFGDKCKPGGNDFPLAHAMKTQGFKGAAFNVTGWRDTWERLQYLQEAKKAA